MGKTLTRRERWLAVAGADRRGTAALEFALAMPMLLVFLIGVTELGFALYESMQVQSAAEAGAVYASQHPTDTAEISAAVVNATSTAGIGATPAPAAFCGCPTAAGIVVSDCTATCTNGDPQSRYIRVSAQLTHVPILDFPGLPNPLVLTGISVVRTQ